MRATPRLCIRRLTTASLLALCAAVPGWAQSLQEAVRLALTTNPSAAAANDSVRAAALDLLQLEEDFLPTVDMSIGGEYLFYTEDYEFATDRARQDGATGQIELSTSYVLFDGYQRANRVYRSAALLDGTLFRLYDASETLALSAVQAYVDVLRHRELLAVSEANVRRHIVIERQVNDLVGGGRLAASATFEARQRVTAARLAVIEVTRALKDANARFEALIGAPPQGQMQAPEAPGLPGSLDAMLAAAIANSHSLAFAASDVQARIYEQAQVEGEMGPQVSVQAGLRGEYDDFDTDTEQTSAFVGLNMTWQLYAGGRKARLSAEGARVQAALSQRQQIARDVKEAATNAWNAYQAGTSQFILLDVQRKTSESIVGEYIQEFEAGGRSLIDLLDAERDLFRARFEAISARAAVTFRGYALLAAQSRLADHFGVDPSNTALIPGFEARALQASPSAIFNTEIRALE